MTHLQVHNLSNSKEGYKNGTNEASVIQGGISHTRRSHRHQLTGRRDHGLAFVRYQASAVIDLRPGQEASGHLVTHPTNPNVDLEEDQKLQKLVKWGLLTPCCKADFLATSRGYVCDCCGGGV